MKLNVKSCALSLGLVWGINWFAWMWLFAAPASLLALLFSAAWFAEAQKAKRELVR